MNASVYDSCLCSTPGEQEHTVQGHYHVRTLLSCNSILGCRVYRSCAEVQDKHRHAPAHTCEALLAFSCLC